MRSLGIGFGLLLATLIGGASLVMVWEYGLSRGDTPMSSYVMGVIGIAAILFSMGGIIWSRGFRHDGRIEIARLIIVGMVIAEFYIIFAELGWWSQNIMAAEQRQKAQTTTARASFQSVQKAQDILERFKSARTVEEINADITAELAKPIEVAKGYERPLTAITKGCTDAASYNYGKCAKVLELRKELATAQKVAAAKMEVGTTVAENIIVKPVNAGAEMASEITGWDKLWLSHWQIILGLSFLAAARLTIMPTVFPERRKNGPLIDLNPVPEAVEAVSLKADAVAQIEAPKAQEAPQEDTQEGAQEVVSDKPKKLTPKQVKKAAKDDPGKIVPFGKVSGATDKSAALESVVSVVCAKLEGEFPVDALWKRIAPRAQARGLNPAKRHIGATLRNLGYTAKKRGTKTVYVINGGASQDAAIA